MHPVHYPWWREDGLADAMRTFLRSGLVISPWLMSTGTAMRFDAEIFATLDKFALEFSHAHWTPEAKYLAFRDLPVPDRMTRTALYEIAASSVSSLALSEGSERAVLQTHVQSVLSLLTTFCAEYGIARLIQLYGLATAFENHQAVAYYQPMKVRDYAIGHLHRPWIDYSLMDELEINLHGNHYRKTWWEGEEVLYITETGRRVTDEIRQVLTESGYMKVRIQHLIIANFNRFASFRDALGDMSKVWLSQRKAFLDLLQVQPGMRVLEIGCADGVFTFDAGLAASIGVTGSLTAVDPAPAMLARVKAKRDELGHSWVQFVQAQAETLPFAADTFDIVTGVAFLHFTDPAQAIAEMVRVAKPGGIVSSFHPVGFQKNLPAFFTEWFAPLYELARANGYAHIRDTLPDEQEVTRLFKVHGLRLTEDSLVTTGGTYKDPIASIDVLIRGVGWGYIELSELPWQARQDFIADLERRGVDICARYPLEERTLASPQQMIVGVKP